MIRRGSPFVFFRIRLLGTPTVIRFRVLISSLLCLAAAGCKDEPKPGMALLRVVPPAKVTVPESMDLEPGTVEIRIDFLDTDGTEGSRRKGKGRGKKQTFEAEEGHIYAARAERVLVTRTGQRPPVEQVFVTWVLDETTGDVVLGEAADTVRDREHETMKKMEERFLERSREE